jgi:FkbM family methyltransferase
MGLLRDLYRRFRLACHKPGHWRLRPRSFDRRAFRDVVLDNEYELPARFGPGDVLLDVGAHVGSFAFAALKRGAGLVYCCEPDPGNFLQLEHNLRPWSDRVRLIPRAVWRSDRDAAVLSLHNPHRAGNTGAYRLTPETVSPPVSVLAFDELVAAATEGGKRIRLLKIDCEGAEWPILLTARTLDRIDAVCGEYHLGDYPEAFHVAGVPEFTPEVLRRRLAEQGFVVQVRPNTRSPDPIGNFLARRAPLRGGAARPFCRSRAT